jgi:hypothetical protein
MPKAKKHRTVEIDERLTDLFISRKSGVEADSSETVEGPISVSADMSWLDNFKTQTSTPADSSLVREESDGSAILHLDLSKVRPFWALEDRKSMISLWKQSKLWLTKDCQKQRKAALRKTSTK